MIIQPSIVTEAAADTAADTVRSKKALSCVEKLRFDAFEGGHRAQTLHGGSFPEEVPTIQRLHEYIQTRGELRRKHHEIYLSDFHRALPDASPLMENRTDKRHFGRHGPP